MAAVRRWRTTIPPAEVAVAVLSRATAPSRRSTADDPRRPGARPVHGDPGSRRPGRRPRLGRGRDRPPSSAQADAAAATRDGAGRRARRPASDAKAATGRGPAVARGRGRTGGRNGPPAGPRTWRRCCAPWAAWYRFRRPLARAACSAAARGLRCTRLPRASARSTSRRRRRRRYSSSAPGAWRSAAPRGARSSVPDVAAGDRPGQRRARCPSARALPSVPVDERPVDGERAGLVEPGDAAELDDRVEQRDEAAGREHRRGVVGRLRARRQADRLRADRLGHLGEQRPRAGRRPRSRRSRRAAPPPPARVGERDERMERADLRPGRHRRREDLGTERAARVDHRLAAVQPQARRRAARWRRRGR